MPPKLQLTVVLLLIFSFYGAGLVDAGNTIEFGMVWESQTLTDRTITSLTAADLNGNHIKEIVLGDIGTAHLPSHPRIVVLEYNGNEFKILWEKKWTDVSKSVTQFNALRRSSNPKVWNLFGHTIVEIQPPFLALEFRQGKYQFDEMYVDLMEKPPINRSIWTWTGNDLPIAVVDLNGFGVGEIVTFERRKESRAGDILRIRSMKPGYPIVWENVMTRPLDSRSFVGRFDSGTPEQVYIPPVLLSAAGKDKYLTEEAVLEKTNSKDRTFLDANGVGSTRRMDLSELWGVQGYYGDKNPLVRWAFNKKMHKFIPEEINVSISPDFLGFSQIALGDVDGDKLDEVVVVEGVGHLGPTDPENTEYGPDILDQKEFIHVLKWDGRKYANTWTSSPFSGKEWISKILVDDVIGIGKKQIVVGTGDGKIQIWERK